MNSTAIASSSDKLSTERLLALVMHDRAREEALSQRLEHNVAKMGEVASKALPKNIEERRDYKNDRHYQIYEAIRGQYLLIVTQSGQGASSLTDYQAELFRIEKGEEEYTKVLAVSGTIGTERGWRSHAEFAMDIYFAIEDRLNGIKTPNPCSFPRHRHISEAIESKSKGHNSPHDQLREYHEYTYDMLKGM